MNAFGFLVSSLHPSRLTLLNFGRHLHNTLSLPDRADDGLGDTTILNDVSGCLRSRLWIMMNGLTTLRMVATATTVLDHLNLAAVAAAWLNIPVDDLDFCSMRILQDNGMTIVVMNHTRLDTTMRSFRCNHDIGTTLTKTWTTMDTTTRERILTILVDDPPGVQHTWDETKNGQANAKQGGGREPTTR